MRRLLAAAMAVILLAACGDGTEDTGVTADAAQDPTEGHWEPIADAPPINPSAPTVWTGSELVVWGGEGGAVYDPTTDVWEEMPAPPIEARTGHSLVWTGEEVLVWGGRSLHPPEWFYDDGAAFDPVARTWRPMSRAPFPRFGHEAVWDGDELVVWGGLDTCCPVDSVIHRAEAAAYEPSSDTWRDLPAAPEPWSGDDGAALTVAADGQVVVWRRSHLGSLGDTTWTELAEPPPVEAPTSMSTAGPMVDGFATDSAVSFWTGEWREPQRGFEFDTAADQWRRLADLPPADFTAVTASPSGAWSLSFSDGDAELRVQHYDRDDDRWSPIASPPVAGRWGASILDTPAGVLVWGDTDATGEPMRDGAIFRPEGTTPTSVDPAPTPTSTPEDALASFVDLATRHGQFGPLELPPHLVDVADLLPTVDWVIAGRDDDHVPTDERSVLGAELELTVVGDIVGVQPLLGRYARPDGDISVPEYVPPDDDRAEDLFVALELSDPEVIAGEAPEDPIRVGFFIGAEELEALRSVIGGLRLMVWTLGAPESTLYDPVAGTGVYAPVFPWFGVIADDGSLSFPTLEDDAAYTDRTGTIDDLRDAAGTPRTITVELVTERDAYVQVDDGRSSAG